MGNTFGGNTLVVGNTLVASYFSSPFRIEIEDRDRSKIGANLLFG